MERHRRLAAIGDGGRAPEVVEVRVGEPDLGDLPGASLCLLQDVGSIPGGVDHYGGPAGRVADEVGIGLYRAQDHPYDGQAACRKLSAYAQGSLTGLPRSAGYTGLKPARQPLDAVTCPRR